MTREELKQEVEEKLLQAELDYCHELSNPCEPSELPYSELLRFETGYKRGYLASAEPREKRIAGLEVTNKRLADECHKLVDTLGKKQKEIAELKEQLEEEQKLNEQIKEFLKRFLSPYTDDLITEAEQFLKECE